MGKKVIFNCDICGNESNKQQNHVKIPTKLIIRSRSQKCYEDVYQEIPYNIFDDTKEIDICDDCLLKIFNSLGVEKQGSILKD